jgi:V8-like Glu-specific endopeptidase
MDIEPPEEDQGWFAPDQANKTYSTGPEDDRRTVKDTDVRPLNSVCRLTDASGIVATGTAIGGRFLLTAGHNLISSSGSIWTAAPAYNKRDIYDAIAVQREIPHPRWRADGDPRFDVGLLVLASAPTHTIPVSTWKDGDDAGHIYVSGYGASHKMVQTFHRGMFGTTHDSLVAHTCDTEAGQSGAPVFTYGNGRTRLIAIHAYGYQDLSDELPGAFNKAVRMTTEIHAWVKQNMSEEGA